MHHYNNNFGTWINFKLDNINKTKTWLEKHAKLSTGSICRWIKGAVPGINNYFAVCTTIANSTNVPISKVIEETLEYMPYLISYKTTPKVCPTCNRKFINDDQKILCIP
jgi:hypothetical protein